MSRKRRATARCLRYFCQSIGFASTVGWQILCLEAGLRQNQGERRVAVFERWMFSLRTAARASGRALWGAVCLHRRAKCIVCAAVAVELGECGGACASVAQRCARRLLARLGVTGRFASGAIGHFTHSIALNSNHLLAVGRLCGRRKSCCQPSISGAWLAPRNVLVLLVSCAHVAHTAMQ